MDENRRTMTKRTFLSLVGTAGVVGCLQRDREDDPEGGSEGNTSSDEADGADEGDDEESSGVRVESDSRITERTSGYSWRDCETLDDWEVIRGSLTSSTNRYTGTQSAHLTADGDSGTEVRIPIDGINLSETTFSLAAYVDRPGDHYSPFFDVNAPDVGRQLHFRTRHKIDEPGWLRYDLGITRTSNLAATDEAYLTISWEGTDVDWYLDDVRAVPVSGDPKLVVQFDDSRQSVYDTAFPIMEDHDVRATMFTVTGRIGNSGSLSLSEMNEMHEAGWEFGSHTVSHPHLATLDRDDQRYQLEESKRWLVDNGFHRGCNTFAFPFGSFTAETIDLVAQYYDLATHGQRGAINRNVTAPLSVNRHPGDDRERATELIDLLLDETVPCDTLILYYHEVVEDHDTWIDPADFRETIEYIDRTDVPLMTTSELWTAQRSFR